MAQMLHFLRYTSRVPYIIFCHLVHSVSTPIGDLWILKPIHSEILCLFDQTVLDFSGFQPEECLPACLPACCNLLHPDSVLKVDTKLPLNVSNRWPAARTNSPMKVAWLLNDLKQCAQFSTYPVIYFSLEHLEKTSSAALWNFIAESYFKYLKKLQL